MLGTVLLVDDDPHVLASLCRTLRREPCSILTASSAAEGLAMMAQHQVDVLVVDERMPGMPGTEMMARVQQDRPEIRKIMLTAHANLESALSAINSGGVFKFLEKPYSEEELRGAVKSALELRAPSSNSEIPSTPPQGMRSLTTEERKLLTVREQEVLTLITDRYKVAQISRMLCVSQHTVRSHLKSVCRKLGAHSQKELADRFRREA